MNVKRASFLATLLLLSTLPLSAFASPLDPQDPMKPQSQPNCQQTQTTHAAGVINTFGGKVIDAHGKFVLLEAASKDQFTLDDQHAAKRYKNRVVVITGTIDLTNKTIHVQKIEAAV